MSNNNGNTNTTNNVKPLDDEDRIDAWVSALRDNAHAYHTCRKTFTDYHYDRCIIMGDAFMHGLAGRVEARIQGEDRKVAQDSYADAIARALGYPK